MKDDLLGKMNNGPRIDPTKFPQVKCDKCGHNVFTSGYVIYNVSGLAVGAGTEDYPYPLPVYICAKCGEIRKDMREEIEKIEKEKEENKEVTKGTSLIL